MVAKGMEYKADRRAAGHLPPHGAEPRAEHAAQAADAQPRRAHPLGHRARARRRRGLTASHGRHPRGVPPPARVRRRAAGHARDPGRACTAPTSTRCPTRTSTSCSAARRRSSPPTSSPGWPQAAARATASTRTARWRRCCSASGSTSSAATGTSTRRRRCASTRCSTTSCWWCAACRRTSTPAGAWWPDVGLGEGFRDPAPLVVGPLADPGFDFEVTAVEAGTAAWSFRNDPRGSFAGLEVRDLPLDVRRVPPHASRPRPTRPSPGSWSCSAATPRASTRCAAAC